MKNGCGVSPYTWESLTILWPNCGVLERHWLKHGPRVITEFVFKLILFLRTNGWILLKIILWNFLPWFGIAEGSSIGIGRCALSIYGEKWIVVRIYWQRGVLLNRKGKCCMIHAPHFVVMFILGFHGFCLILKSSRLIRVQWCFCLDSSLRLWFGQIVYSLL